MVRALVLKVVDKNGKVVDQREIDTDILNMYLERRKDLGTDWFGKLLYAAFQATHPHVCVASMDGSQTCGDAKFCFAGLRCNFWIGVGTGTTPPTRQDYKLEAEKAVRPGVAQYLEGTGIVIISAMFVFNYDVDISEIGLFLCDGDIAATDPGVRTLLDRTVLDAPVHVAAQQTLYVEYRIAI